MKKLLRNKRKGYAHFSYMKSLQRPFPDPKKLIMAFPYIGPLTMQSKAAKRLRKERAKPWKYLWSKGYKQYRQYTKLSAGALIKDAITVLRGMGIKTTFIIRG